MANSKLAGAPQTLAEMYDLEKDESIPYDMAVRITASLGMSLDKKPDVLDAPPRPSGTYLI